MCSVGFSDDDLVDAPSAEAIGRTGVVPGSVGATRVWLLLMGFFSQSQLVPFQLGQWIIGSLGCS